MTEQATTTQAPTTPAEQRPEPFARKAKNKLGNCECSQWEIGETVLVNGGNEDDGVDVTIITTGCDKTTKRDFAQGHDAKLKSLFIRAGVEGLEVRWGRQAGLLVTTDAETAARRFGFGEQVQKGILSRLDKLARGGKKIAPAPRAVAAEVVEGSQEGDLQDPEFGPLEIPEAPAEQDTWTDEAAEAVDELLADPELAEMVGDEIKVQGKIGRWTYEGTVDEDGAFTYTGGSGETKVAEAGKWSLVAL